MRKKLLSLTLALFYFSVSIILSSPHAHNHSNALAHQQNCIACAWHFEANADVPTGPALISVPLQIAIQTPAPDVQADSIAPRRHADRGPPLRS
ncbi:MAG TPA: hypothetical protein VI282_12035 [Verrucomicrobiae bacterium]|jgi:hypothetical protein